MQQASHMRLCQILQFTEHGKMRWKWRHVAPEGAVTESPETYAFHYECVAAARKSGYTPKAEWLTEA